MQKDYTVVVLGAGGVGKTAMISQFMNGLFPNDYSPTIEDCYRQLIQLPGKISVILFSLGITLYFSDCLHVKRLCSKFFNS